MCYLKRGLGSWQSGQRVVEAIMQSVQKKRLQWRQRYPSSFATRRGPIPHVTRESKDFAAGRWL
jgi:hypothetical protein